MKSCGVISDSRLKRCRSVRRISKIPRRVPILRTNLKSAKPAYLGARSHPLIVEVATIPPSLHVALAEANRTLREHSCVKALVVDANIRRAGTVDLDIDVSQQIDNNLWFAKTRPL